MSSIRRRWLPAALVAAVLVSAAWTRSEPAAKFQAIEIAGIDWGHDFHLVDPTGAPRSLADYRGKAVMLFFGYTNCPDACPATLAKMAQAVDRLGPNGSRVQGLFVTVDPARDTRAILAQYVPAFHPSFVGLTADDATIAATAKDFKVFYAPAPADGHGVYTVDHSSGIFVFDSEGHLRLFMGPSIGIDTMVHDLELLIRSASKAAQRSNLPGERSLRGRLTLEDRHES